MCQGHPTPTCFTFTAVLMTGWGEGGGGKKDILKMYIFYGEVFDRGLFLCIVSKGITTSLRGRKIYFCRAIICTINHKCCLLRKKSDCINPLWQGPCGKRMFLCSMCYLYYKFRKNLSQYKRLPTPISVSVTPCALFDVTTNQLDCALPELHLRACGKPAYLAGLDWKTGIQGISRRADGPQGTMLLDFL